MTNKIVFTEDPLFIAVVEQAELLTESTGIVHLIYEVIDPFPRGEVKYEILPETEADTVKTNMAWKRTWTVFPESVG